MRKEPKTVVVSYIILPNGSMSGVAMFRYKARKEKIQRLFNIKKTHLI